MKKKNKIIMGLSVAAIAALSPVMMTACGPAKQDLTEMNAVIDRAVETLGFEKLSEENASQTTSAIAYAEEIGYSEMETVFDEYFTEDEYTAVPKEFILAFTGVAVHLRAIDRGLDVEGDNFALNDAYGQAFTEDVNGQQYDCDYYYRADWNNEEKYIEIQSAVESAVAGQTIREYSVTLVEAYGDNGFALKTKWVSEYLFADGSAQYNYIYMSVKVDGDSVDELIAANGSSDKPITNQTIEQWIASGENVSGHLTGSYKNNKGAKELTETEQIAVAKIMIEDMNINFTDFEKKFDVKYEEVEWIQPAVKECRDIVNELNGVQ